MMYLAMLSEVESVDNKISDESKAAYVVSSLTDNVVTLPKIKTS